MNLCILRWVKFLTGVHFISAVLIPYFTTVSLLTIPEVLFLQSLFGVFIFLLEVPTGVIADRYSRKLSFILSVITNILALALLLFVNGFWPVMLVQFLLALSVALSSGALESLAYDSLLSDHKQVMNQEFKEKSKKLFSDLDSLFILGIFIGGLLGSVIVALLSIKFTVIFQILMNVLAVIFSVFLIEPKLHSESEVMRVVDILRSGVSLLFKNKYVLAYSVDFIFFTAAAFLVVWFYQPLMLNYNVDIKYFGLMHASIAVSQISFNFLFSRVTFNLNKFFIFTALIIIVAYSLLPLNLGWFVSLFLVDVIMGVGMARKNLLISEINHFVPSSVRSTLNSTVSMMQFLFRSILIFIAGILIIYNINYIFVFFSIFLIFALFYSVFLRKDLL